jgi:hypothetical protein
VFIKRAACFGVKDSIQIRTPFGEAEENIDWRETWQHPGRRRACRLNSIRDRGKALAKCNLACCPPKTQLQHRHLAELRPIFIISPLISILSNASLDNRRNSSRWLISALPPRSLETADSHYCVYEMTRANEEKKTKL